MRQYYKYRYAIGVINKFMVLYLSVLLAYLFRYIGIRDTGMVEIKIAWIKPIPRSAREQTITTYLGLAKLTNTFTELPQWTEWSL